MKSRRLAIDVSPLLDNQWTGIPVFTRRLLVALSRDARLKLIFSIDGREVSQSLIKTTIDVGSGTVLRDQLSKSASLGKRIGTRSDYLLFPSVKKACGSAAHEASTVHDLSTLFMPENHETANVIHHLENLESEFKSNEVVFCASEATRSAATTAFPSISKKARVLYQYSEWPEEFSYLDRNCARIRLGRYAIVMGTVEPRKNLGLILNALQNKKIERSEISFVVIGKQGWLMDDFLSDVDPVRRRRLVFTGFVSEFAKYRLLKNSEFLIFPSLYEGFGIPALEAMSLGKPVLAARTSSFPEVVGGAGIFFDPFSVSEFVDAFGEIQQLKRLRELANLALIQSAKFDWRRMAAPVVDWANGR